MSVPRTLSHRTVTTTATPVVNIWKHFSPIIACAQFFIGRSVLRWGHHEPTREVRSVVMEVLPTVGK